MPGLTWGMKYIIFKMPEIKKQEGVSMANLQVKIDDSLRDDAQRVANQIGLDVATAVRMFLVQMVKANGLPFHAVADPFYSVANQRYLERAAEAVKNGANIVHHDMIED
jgi:DNA-damage-inducible protein J